MAGGRKKSKAPHHPPQLALSWFPQPWHPVRRIQIGDCKTATRVYSPTRWPGTPLTVQPSPKTTPTSGVLPSQRLPTCGNIKLPNDFTGIHESSHPILSGWSTHQATGSAASSSANCRNVFQRCSGYNGPQTSLPM